MLSELLKLPPRPLISLVGAGGKTTTMYTLASELARQDKHVIITTTTNIYIPKAGETDTLIVSLETPTLIKMTNAAWKQHHRVTIASKVIGAGKMAGLQPDQPHELFAKSGADLIIVEADGARHSMIKAPAEHEPVIPPQTNVVLLMMSAEAIDKPLSTEVAHRPERIASVLGISQGDILTPERIARLIISEQGGMKNIPQQARVYVLITHVVEKQPVVQRLVSLLQYASRLSEVFCSAEPGSWFTP